MLSKDEEQRLEQYLNRTWSELSKDLDYSSLNYLNAITWLAEKLKEVNEELKAIKENASLIENKRLEIEAVLNNTIEDYECGCIGISHIKGCPLWVFPF